MSIFLLLDRLAHKLIKQLVFLGFFLYADVWLWLTCFFIFGFLGFGHNRSGGFRRQFEAFRNTADFRCVLRTGNHIDLRIGVFVSSVRKDAVKYAVLFSFLRKLLQVAILYGKDFQFLARTEHIGKPCFALCFLFLFQNGIEENGDVLRTCTCDFGCDLKSFQAHSDDLFCRFAACIHSSSAPFVVVLHLPVWWITFL